MINFEYYKIFYFAAKYGNFTRAARVLHTSQSAISHSMQNLEHELGCRLFVRSNRGIELTPEGKILRGHVAAGCEQFFKGESALSESTALKEGAVYIAATETALHCYLFDVLNRFHAAYPNVRFKLMNCTASNAAISTLKNGTTDFAVVPSPIYIKKPLMQSDVLPFQDILITGPQYAHLAASPISLRDIADYPFICLTEGTSARHFFNDLFSSHAVNISPDIELATTDMILPLVRSNLGVGFVPEPIAREAIERGEVHQIRIRETLPGRAISLIWDGEAAQSFAAQAFYRFLTVEG